MKDIEITVETKERLTDMGKVIDLTRRKKKIILADRINAVTKFVCRLCGVLDLLLILLVLISIIFSFVTNGEVPSIIDGDLAFKQFMVLATGLFVCACIGEARR